MTFGDVRDLLVQMPNFALDNVDSVRSDNGYEARVALCRDAEARSVFEFGCQYGHGLMSLLEACPNATRAGWIDNEGAHAGSNAAALENLEHYQLITGRSVELWHGVRARQAIGLQYDVVMVDGAHGRNECLSDLTLALAMRPRLIVVDDYRTLESVRQAVGGFAEYHGFEVEAADHVGAGLAFFRNLT